MNTPKGIHPALKSLINFGNIHIPAEKIHTQVQYSGEAVNIAEENKKLLNIFIENLEIEIDKSIQEKVRALTGRLVLITGDDLYLLEAVQAYIYCIKGETNLYFHNIAGKTTEGEVIDILHTPVTYRDSDDKIKTGNVIDQLNDGVTVLLNILSCYDDSFLMKLVSDIQHTKNNTGMLIITTFSNKDELPKYFTNLFEVISLEPEMQGQGNGQGITGSISRSVNTFPIPPTAKVSDIKMVFMDEENIRITIEGESKTFNCSQMGFSKKTNNLPLAEWDTFLEYAEYNGSLRKVDRKKQKHSERIKGKLKEFFQTDKDLIVSHQTVFKISKKETSSKKPAHIHPTECLVCKETHSHYCHVCEDVTDHCKECHNELYAETHKKLNR